MGQTAVVPMVSAGARRYDKGERRHKHSGKSASATIDMGNPKRVIGKCPNNIMQAQRERLLQAAITLAPVDPELGYNKHLYLSYEGTIYECATSDYGTTYHAYPYHGSMLRGLIAALRAQPDAQSYPVEFDRWIRDHVGVRG